MPNLKRVGGNEIYFSWFSEMYADDKSSVQVVGRTNSDPCELYVDDMHVVGIGHRNLTLLSRNPICRPDASLTFESQYRVSSEDHRRPHSLSNLSQTIDIRSPSSVVRGKRTPRQNLNQGQKGYHKEVNI
ncbi:unnamed protein product [Lactuca saligna]|uniref:Uncharacterized protein n=1 Tax=Lactuca saligna TaxID=75948 RepID=A0AA35Y952_LACSI|nr:unnamed protein product [Lactuca saligna]